MNLPDILRATMLAVRKLGAYALLELVVPGGTILALLLYLYRRHRDGRAGTTGRFAGRAFVVRKMPRQPTRRAPRHTLNLKCMTSPSWTTYSLPSRRSLPASRAPASPFPAM